MSGRSRKPTPPEGGIFLSGSSADAGAVIDRIEALGLAAYVDIDEAPPGTSLRLKMAAAEELAPGCGSIELSSRLRLDPWSEADDLEREILLSLMLSPVRFVYASHDELRSAIRVRQNIVGAARKTVLAFDTAAAERPSDCWRYSPEGGFTLLPGQPLIESLRKATQPEVSGRLYSFSCYRATEYVILLGLAEELAGWRPEELARLQRQWEKRAIKSGAFHETFLVEYGSMQSPLPPRHYVPGDRLWFRNPDQRSSDISGFEGSWVFYHGGGQFTNFWKAGEPFTLTSKCLEIHHWRHGVYEDLDGNLRMDETLVAARVEATLSDQREVRAIVAQMMRLREAKGSYGNGGCIDTSREYPKPVCHGAPALELPDA